MNEALPGDVVWTFAGASLAAAELADLDFNYREYSA